MQKDSYRLSPNPLVQYLNKPAQEFTKKDLMTFVEHNQVEMINFHYVAQDGRLKTLNFVINSFDHLDQILSSGERVDGSSLFSHIDPAASDLYVVPRYRTAFMNPFSEIPTLSLLCSFFTKDGKPLDSAPDEILRKAGKTLVEKTGFEFHCMGELEYYVISEEDPMFPATDQKGYHESHPFNKMAEIRKEAMHIIAQCGGEIKYGHSEVGNFIHEGMNYEQNEIEFQPVHLEEAADQLIIAKWVLRNLAHDYGVTVTFSPKITVGKAGSGMHIHTKLVSHKCNAFITNKTLNDTAKKSIAGYLDLAASLTAFGNMNPTSYLRLVPHQEAPTNICWGDRNRSTLVRVPLGWTGSDNMAQLANPLEEADLRDFSCKQTVEFRCSDGTADVYLLIAGLAVAARHGLEMDNALEYADKTYVDVNIFDDEHKAKLATLDTLPDSCASSAKALEAKKEVYMKYDVFTENIINQIIANLQSFNDANIRQEIKENPDKLMEMLDTYFYCG